MAISVGIICNQMIPYRIPVFNELAGLVDFRVEVMYLSRTEKNRQWSVEGRLEHPHVLLPSVSTYVTGRDWPIHIHWGLQRELDRLKPDVIVTMGYDSPGFWQGARWAARNGAGRVLYFGSTALSSRNHGGVIGALRRRIVRETDAFYTYGTWSRDYLVSLGAHWEDIFTGTNTVDVERIAAMTDAATPIERKAEHELLYVGQLIPRKGVDTLIRGLARLPERNFRLHIVGSGPQEAQLRRLVSHHGLEEHILFHGFRQSEALAPFFAGCDILVMPSHREVWGLVVNEALAAGLFVVAGQNAGCVPDLINYGVNGLTVDTTDPQHMADVLARAMGAGRDRVMIRSSILHHTPERTAWTLARAIIRADHRARQRAQAPQFREAA